MHYAVSGCPIAAKNRAVSAVSYTLTHTLTHSQIPSHTAKDKNSTHVNLRGRESQTEEETSSSCDG